MALPDLIWICGRMCAGKDYVAEQLVRNGYARLPLALAVKEQVAQQLGLSLEELERRKGEFRSELQFWGVSKRENENEHYWIDEWYRRYQALVEAGQTRVVVPDVRFNNEALFAIGLGGFVMRVKTPDDERIRRYAERYGVRPTKEQWSHSSEVDVDTLPVHLDLPGTLPALAIIPAIEGAFGKLMMLRNKVRQNPQPKLKAGNAP